MRATHLAIGVVVVSLLVVGAAAPAAAQVDENNGEAICEGTPGSGDSLVVVLPDGTYVHADDEVTLLPGTEADIVLCSGGDVVSTSAWPVSDTIDGVNVTSTDEFSYAITIDPVETRTEPDFGSAIDQRGEVNTPDVAVVPGRVTTARVGDKSYQIALGSDQRNTFMNANTSYTTTLNEMRNAAAALNNSAGQIDPNNSVPDDQRASNVNQTDTLNGEYTTIQERLFSSAAGGNADAVAALDAYEQRHTTSLAETRNHLRNANEAIRSQARSTALGVLANFIGVALVGAIIGGFGGRAVTNRILSDVEVNRRRSSAVDFSPKHLAGQIGVALLLIIGAVALVVVLGLLDPLVAVVQAVIGL
jgi:hypothetical protein